MTEQRLADFAGYKLSTVNLKTTVSLLFIEYLYIKQAEMLVLVPVLLLEIDSLKI